MKLRYILLVALLSYGLLALALTSTAGAKGYENKTLGIAASKYAGQKRTVKCDDLAPGFFGWTWVYGDEIHLNRSLCNPLTALFNGKTVAPYRQAVGVLVLTHETLHTLGSVNEARTQCLAVQGFDDTLAVNGVRWTEQLFADMYDFNNWFTHVAPTYWNERLCFPGRAWDESPNDGVWP